MRTTEFVIAHRTGQIQIRPTFADGECRFEERVFDGTLAPLVVGRGANASDSFADAMRRTRDLLNRPDPDVQAIRDSVVAPSVRGGRNAFQQRDLLFSFLAGATTVATARAAADALAVLKNREVTR